MSTRIKCANHQNEVFSLSAVGLLRHILALFSTLSRVYITRLRLLLLELYTSNLVERDRGEMDRS
jgi:hypothetical protein